MKFLGFLSLIIAAFLLWSGINHSKNAAAAHSATGIESVVHWAADTENVSADTASKFYIGTAIFGLLGLMGVSFDD